jgi:hypothetical protein
MIVHSHSSHTASHRPPLPPSFSMHRLYDFTLRGSTTLDMSVTELGAAADALAPRKGVGDAADGGEGGGGNKAGSGGADVASTSSDGGGGSGSGDGGAASADDGGGKGGGTDTTAAVEGVTVRLRFLQTLLRMLDSSSKIENTVMTPKLCRLLKTESDALLATASLGRSGPVRAATAHLLVPSWRGVAWRGGGGGGGGYHIVHVCSQWCVWVSRIMFLCCF